MNACIVAVVPQVDGAFVESVTPENTAVFSGYRVVLRCHTNQGDSAAISWRRELVDGTKAIVVGGCNVLSRFVSVYNVSSDGRGQCDLVINSVNTSLTGLYSCIETQTTSAYVTIIGQLLNMLILHCFYFMVDIRRPISSIESGVLYSPIISLDCDH